MRELTFLETGYLAAGLLLCLTMPLLMSFRGPHEPKARKLGMKIVWTGQLLLAFTGLIVLLSSRTAPYAVALGFAGYIACTSTLFRRLRPAPIPITAPPR
jgi:hypothetical protein